LAKKLTNREALQYMLKYIDEAQDAGEAANNDFHVFNSTSIYYNAISMSLMSIGELSAQLSNEIKQQYTSVPWREMVGMRNYFAHGYWIMTPVDIWRTYQNDVPELKIIIEKILTENTIFLDELANGRSDS